jgi:AcrR family transcriptional regulator
MAQRKRKGNGVATASGGSADPENKLIDAALMLAARQGWRRTGLGEIAAAAGLPLADAYALHPTKLGILDAFTRRIDRAVLAGTGPAAEDPWRDRLFDVLMRRFDALQPHREALRAILRDSIGDPQALWGAASLLRSMAWMLEAAGLPAGGWRGGVRVHLLAALYASVFRVFLGDDSADLTKTMAALDHRLRRAESFLGRRGRGRAEAG